MRSRVCGSSLSIKKNINAWDFLIILKSCFFDAAGKHCSHQGSMGKTKNLRGIKCFKGIVVLLFYLMTLMVILFEDFACCVNLYCLGELDFDYLNSIEELSWKFKTSLMLQQKKDKKYINSTSKCYGIEI